MLNVVNNTEDAVKRGAGCRALNDHGNYIIDHGKIMEKSWNFVFEFLWEPCTYNNWVTVTLNLTSDLVSRNCIESGAYPIFFEIGIPNLVCIRILG